jgi:hypothetical protein
MTMVLPTFSVSRMPIWMKPLRRTGVGKPRRLSRSSPAATAAGDVVLMADNSAAVSRLRPSSASMSTIVSSLANGALRNSSSCEPRPVAS